MVKGDYTTLLIEKKDKILFNKLYNLYCETIFKTSHVPREYFKKPTKHTFFNFLIEDYNKLIGIVL